MSADYTSLGFNSRLRKGIAARPSDYRTAALQDTQDEIRPWTNPTQINKGSSQVNLGGVFELRDTTGGTILLTADPDTGVVTIKGSLVAEQNFDAGTISDSVLAGSTVQTGTFLADLMTGTLSITAGTADNIILGTPDITGGTVDSAVMGTPNVAGGTHNNAFFGTLQTANGTIGTPTITGTPTMSINAGSPALGASGNIALQTLDGSAIIAVRSAGITYRFISNGTL